jgi:hypothetical protein
MSIDFSLNLRAVEASGKHHVESTVRLRHRLQYPFKVAFGKRHEFRRFSLFNSLLLVVARITVQPCAPMACAKPICRRHQNLSLPAHDIAKHTRLRHTSRVTSLPPHGFVPPSTTTTTTSASAAAAPSASHASTAAKAVMYQLISLRLATVVAAIGHRTRHR